MVETTYFICVFKFFPLICIPKRNIFSYLFNKPIDNKICNVLKALCCAKPYLNQATNTTQRNPRKNMLPQSKLHAPKVPQENNNREIKNKTPITNTRYKVVSVVPHFTGVIDFIEDWIKT